MIIFRPPYSVITMDVLIGILYKTTLTGGKFVPSLISRLLKTS